MVQDKTQPMEYIYLDLFSGVGGFAKGFQDAGLTFEKHYFSEIDNHAIAVYKHNFKNTKYVGSVTDVSGTILRNKHPRAKFIITFGFPCQDLSIAGKGKGLDGERSGLFFEAIRLVKEIKPEVFIFENVKGLLSSNEGKDFETVLRTIANLGLYECEWQLVNTAWILPQNRERVYFVGHLAGQSTPRVFPFRETDFGITQRQSNSATVRTITAGGHSGGHHSGMTLIQRGRGYNKGGEKSICPTISANSFEENNHIQVKPVITPNRKEKRQNGRRFKEDGEPSFTLNTQDQHGVMINSQIRRLTEIECERLQGFPDNWTQYGNYNGEIKKVSKTQRYKQLGNAVTTDMPRIIAQRLFPKI